MAKQKIDVRKELEEQRDKELVNAVVFELEGAIAHAGGRLTGLSVKFGELDTLMTLRAHITANRVVSFVGAPTMADCFRKAVVDAYHDNLRWRTDEYAKK